MEKSSGVKTLKVIEYVWMAVTPVLVIIIMCFSIIGYKRIEYGSYVVCIYFEDTLTTISFVMIIMYKCNYISRLLSLIIILYSCVLWPGLNHMKMLHDCYIFWKCSHWLIYFYLNITLVFYLVLAYTKKWFTIVNITIIFNWFNGPMILNNDVFSIQTGVNGLVGALRHFLLFAFQ